jgi:sulfite reductase (NADPH) flavoprotein alpha-component
MVQRGYVQDVLAAEAARLREWVEAGAAIYVCGSLTGMAAGVEQALTVVLGTDVVQALRASGRYRRDVY